MTLVAVGGAVVDMDAGAGGAVNLRLRGSCCRLSSLVGL